MSAMPPPSSPYPPPVPLPAAFPRSATAPMRIAIVTESFLPQVNGVTNSVCRIAEHLAARGHQALIVAPGPGPTRYAGFPVLRLPALPLPGYRSFSLGLPARRLLTTALRAFAPDVVHLASPAVLGHATVEVARRWALPTVAVFQTDLAGFAARNGVPAGRLLWRHLRRIHAAVDRTLVPSTATLRGLAARGFPRLTLWRRGVDTERFNPAHRSEDLRRRLAPDGALLVGYVGRLARDKRVSRLAQVAKLRGTRLVVVGDGPERSRLRRMLPEESTVLLGERTGAELSALYAAFDVFVHTGTDETFCQAVQEALASGVPVVAPAAGGPLDLVSPGANGLLYSPESDGELRWAVERLLRDPVLRARLAEAAPASVRERTWERINDELIAHYRAVAAPSAALLPGGPPPP